MQDLELDGAVSFLVFMVFVFGLPWLLSESWNYPFRTEVTVYLAFCPDGVQSADNGCSKGEQNANPMSYKAVPATQTMLWWGNDGAPHTLKVCAVRDAFNWSCELGEKPAGPGERSFVYQMVDGNYSDVSNIPGYVPIFYQVSKFHWYWNKLKIHVQ